MTDQKDLKRRIRARMTKTGESFTAARAQVLAQRPEPPPPPPRAPAFDVIEPLDLDELAASLAYRCSVRMFPALAAVVSPEAALTRLRDALLATEGDPSTRSLRACAFRGEAVSGGSWSQEARSSPLLRDYLARVRAGIGGPSPGGAMLALQVDEHTVLAIASALRAPQGGEPRAVLWLHAVTESLGTYKIAGLLPR